MTNLPPSKALALEANSPYTKLPAGAVPAAPSDWEDPSIPDDGATELPDILDDAQVRAFSNSKEGRKIVQWVDDNFRDARNKRRAYERQWYLNIAFYSGKQYVEWSSQTDAMVTQKVMSLHTPRLTINKIQPIVRTEISKMIGQKPSVNVLPSSNDDADMFAATAGEQVWESLYSRLNLPNKLSRMAFWLSTCGTAFIKAYWDDGMYDNVAQAEGDICWLPLSPFHLLVPDMLEEDIEMQSWVMDVQVRPTTWVKEHYGDHFPKGVSPSVAGTDDIISAAAIGVKGGEAQKFDSTNVKEVWVKPGTIKELPEGGMVTVIDSVIVQAAIHGMPYPHKEYPYAKFTHIPTGKFYAGSTVDSLIPLQREYNRTQSQLVESKNRILRNSYFFRDGSLDVARITTEPGSFIPVKGSADYPQPVQVLPMPQYVTDFNKGLDGNFEDISGQHSQTRGEAPSGQAATAIAYLQEQDDAYLAPTFQSIEQGIQKIARHSLVLAASYWTLPRLVKATGEDGGFDAVMLRGSQIANATDVRVEGGTALPTSKSALQATVSDWMKNGFLPPEDGFELMQMPQIQAFVNKKKVDKKAAQIENIAFRSLDPAKLEQDAHAWIEEQQANQAVAQIAQLTGENPDAEVAPPNVGDMDPATLDDTGEQGMALAPPLAIPVNSWDDHAIHILIHNLWRKSPSYAFVPGAVKAEVQKHVDMHEQALQLAATQQALAAQGAMPPQSPGGANALPQDGPPQDVASQTGQQATLSTSNDAQYQSDQAQDQQL